MIDNVCRTCNGTGVVGADDLGGVCTMSWCPDCTPVETDRCRAAMPNRGFVHCPRAENPEGHRCIATAHETGPQGYEHVCLCGSRFSLPGWTAADESASFVEDDTRHRRAQP